MKRSFLVLAASSGSIMLLLLILGSRYGAAIISTIISPIDSVASQRVQSIAQNQTGEWVNQWHGVAISQYPNDLISYENLLFDLKPDFVIETGTFYGGLSIYLATVLESMGGTGKILTVDIDSSMWEKTLRSVKIKQEIIERIVFFHGNSIGADVYEAIAKIVAGHSVLTILDSNHSKAHVLQELTLYSRFVDIGGYIVVNDTDLADSAYTGYGPGPLAAIREFISNNAQFKIDASRDRYIVSCMHSGFLKRVS